MDLKITFPAGEICPEYDILKPDGSRAKDDVDYAISIKLKDKGVFIVTIMELYVNDKLGIVVRETTGDETRYHVHKNDGWIETTDLPGEIKTEIEPKKKPVKIEFAEEPPVVANCDIAGKIVRWCSSEIMARSTSKMPDGNVRITAMNKDVGPQLKAKIEKYFLYDDIGAEVKEMTTAGGHCYIIAGQKSEPERGGIESPGSRSALEKISDKILHDPEVKMLCEKFGITSKYSSITDRLIVSSPARHAKELMLIMEGIADASVAVLVDKKRFRCSIVDAKDSERFSDMEAVPIDSIRKGRRRARQ